MNIPSQLKYTKEHEWAKIEGNVATIGITDHAQSSLGDIVYLDLPKVGRELKAGEVFGVVESIKAVSDLYSPIAGKVIATHGDLVADPAKINQDPYEGSWMLKIEMSQPGDASGLMDAAAYAKYVESVK